MASRKQNDFLLLNKAKDMAQYTINLTDNTRRFPKKYRFTFVNRMQDMVLDIYELINSANELNIKDSKELKERLYLQNKAIAKCKTLLFLITLCMENKSIKLNVREAKAWSKYVIDVKNMTISWHSKDRKR